MAACTETPPSSEVETDTETETETETDTETDTELDDYTCCGVTGIRFLRLFRGLRRRGVQIDE